MDLEWGILLKSAIVVITGVFLVRLSGRKSISQMTVATTVVMIATGELLAHSIVGQEIWRSLAAVAAFLLTLLVLEWLTLKSDRLQWLIAGKPVKVIEDGKVDLMQLRKLRMTIELLEMRLRQEGISSMSDVKNATIEINGELGYELVREKQSLTVGEFEKWMEQWLRNPEPPPADVSSPSMFSTRVLLDHPKNLQ
ncbi:DUF421 domain-containing protein [Paenibacillus cremeus]|uniref:DUF421 domain-containing protein n=1 Tax=Paenibacillus cremeus TaxID=2163881 RepID=A0A559KH29_9BACL|nr:YetF domain-containing protein [Paenibacillus cremeus]TVY11388.1 DUF421 domain-containing protein [Paenibacillus cremeus]